MKNTGRVEILTVESEVLRGNPLGDPSTREVPVYLPPSYDDEQRRFPVIYVLTGFTGFGRGLLNRGAWEEALDQRMDRLIAEGCPEVILVMPDCFTRFGGSQYMNSTALGRYEDHLLEEVLPQVDRRYRTVGHREGRGVLGKSSGGYGALRMAMLHADRFAAAASHSGDAYFELCYRPDFPRLLNAIGRTGGVQEFVNDFYARTKLGTDEILSMSVLAMAAAYSPNPSTPPFGIDLPFDSFTGELDEAVWRRWQENDPVYMVDRYQEQLRTMRFLFVDCGTRDEYNLHYGARILVQRCRKLGIEVQHEEFDDNHRGLSYRYDRSIPAMTRSLSAE